MSAVRGAISAAANAATLSRSMSAVSPRAKSSGGRAFGGIFGLRAGLLQLGSVGAGLAPPGNCADTKAGGASPTSTGTSHPGISGGAPRRPALRSEEHTSELQSLMRISYAVFCLKKKKNSSIHQE